MKTDDVMELRGWLSSSGNLDSANRDLIDNAIFCLKNGSDYRAECSIRALAANLRNAGEEELAKAAERIM